MVHLGDTGGPDLSLESTFTTGTASTTAPEPPVVLSVTEQNQLLYPATDYTVVFEAPGDPTWVRVDFHETADAAAFSTHWLAPATIAAGEATFTDGECGDSPGPGYPWVTLVSFNHAGEGVESIEAVEAGCNSATTPATGMLTLLGLLAGFRRRRSA